MANSIGGIAGDRLRSFIERIERLESEKRELAADIKEVYAEAKGTGFDTKTIRRIVKERTRDHDDVEEALYALYKRALGEFVSTPLGAAAMRAVEPAAA